MDLLYELDQRPPFTRTLLYGAQWLIIFLPTLTVLSVLVADVLGLSAAGRLAFFQRLVILTGLTTLIESTFYGHKLPIVDGPAAALVITLATLAPGGQADINGGMIVGGVLVFLSSVFGLTRRLTPLFTDRVVGVILLLIGLTIIPYLLPMFLGANADHPHGRPLVLGLSLSLSVGVMLMIHYLKRFWQSLALFIGVLAGTALFALLGLTDFSQAAGRPWLTAPDPARLVRPTFDLAAGVSFALAYLAVMVNTAGSIYSLKPLLEPRNMEQRFDRSMKVAGLAGAVAGAFSSVGLVPYSLSPGIITVTRVGSRFALTAAGAMLLMLGFFGKIAAFLSSVPDAVVAAALLASVSAAVGVSIEIINQGEGVHDKRTYMVVGAPVMLGAAASQAPEAFLNLLPAALKPILSNGLIVGVIAVLLLEHVILRERSSRPEDQEKGERS